MNITHDEIQALRTADDEERNRILDDLGTPRLNRLSPVEQAMHAYHWVKNANTGELGILFVGATIENESQQVYLVLNPDKPGDIQHWPADQVHTTEHDKITKPE